MADAPLRVVFVGPMLGSNPGWVPSPAEELAAQLTVRSHEVLLTSRQVGRLRRAGDTVRSLIAWRGRYDVAVVFAYSGRAFALTDLATMTLRRIGRPVILALHGGALPDFAVRHPSWVRRVLGRAAVVVAPSGYLTSQLRRAHAEIRVLPNGLDIDATRFRERSPARHRLLWLRTFHPLYRPDLALDVLRELRTTHPDVHLTMAGQDRGSRVAVEQRARDLGLTDIRFDGFLDSDAKRAAFDDHDIYLHTNAVDNAPVTVVEAAAAGMVLVASRVGGIPHLLHHGEDALVGEGTAAELADLARRALDDDALAGRLSRGARDLALTHAWQRIVPEWESLLRDVSATRTAVAP